ncbi:hypothetical protein PSA5_11995 [Pseudomonas syringae pv. actinidiae]|uniref:Uncharacterized protein n=1 Tax=Pseudomonas syringae pv. actinidiae TaxID=103796 RepID=A0AAN4TJA5_PSESF|nr:hypothetical protein PSA5_11995 [Pseudomonas syringae pv. actinidiae]GBH15224.1 hypothetical protein KPSA3_01147 [Pseudomonas syringae pv. actinidiae]
MQGTEKREFSFCHIVPFADLSIGQYLLGQPDLFFDKRCEFCIQHGQSPNVSPIAKLLLTTISVY